MCTCNPSSNTEEYHIPFSEFEAAIPEDRYTSTRYYEEEFIPEYYSTPKRIIQDNQHAIPRTRLRSTSRRLDLTIGVAIVPRRNDFDAVSDVEDEADFDARETLRLKNAAQRPTYIPESTVAPGTYRLRCTRATQYPSDYRKQNVPKMVKMAPCGKCIRI